MILVDNENTIYLEKLNDMSEKMFDHLVKAVVGTQKSIMVVDALMHAWGNRSRGVDDPTIQKQIRKIVTNLVKR